MCCTEANNCCLYKTVAERFCFFSHFDGMCDKEVKPAARKLVQTYPDDLENTFPNEHVQFGHYFFEPL